MTFAKPATEWEREKYKNMFLSKGEKRKRMKYSSMESYINLTLRIHGEWKLVSKHVPLLVPVAYIGMLLVTETSWHGTACIYACGLS